MNRSSWRIASWFMAVFRSCAALPPPETDVAQGQPDRLGCAAIAGEVPALQQGLGGPSRGGGGGRGGRRGGNAGQRGGEGVA